MVEYGRHLGRLDDIPRLTLSREAILKERISPEEISLIKLIDGIASLGDIVRGSHLGRFEAYRAFMLFRERGWMSTRAPTGAWVPSAPLPVASPAPVSPPEEARAPSVRPPPSAPPPAEPQKPITPEFDQLFQEATEAYVRRDYQRAIELFTRCLALRPDDRRVQHNLQRLQARRTS